MNFKRLQHLSDIRAIITEKEIGNENCFPCEQTIKPVISSFLIWLSESLNKPLQNLSIAVGHDSRLSGKTIKDVIIRTMSGNINKIFDCGLTPTPALQYFILNRENKIDGAVMITASHLSKEFNGLKFFTQNGGIEINELSYILEKAENISIPSFTQSSDIKTISIIDNYIYKIKSFIIDSVHDSTDFEKPLKGLKILVDAGNGTAGFFADLLSDLGADTTGSFNLLPDGNFPAHQPNTEDEIAIQELRKQVIENQANLGIIFDADMDKASLITSDESLIIGNSLVALIAAIVLEENPKSTIVTDSITSDWVTAFIQNELKGYHHRFRRGYKRLINEAKRLNREKIDCPVAIETSGHSAFRENGFVDDGAFMVSKVLIKLALFKKQNINILKDLINKLHIAKKSYIYRLQILVPDYEKEANKILLTVKKFCENVPGWKIHANNFEGVRISADKIFGDGWMHLRLSLHEPCIVLHIESNSESGMKMLISRIYKILSRFPSLNSSCLKP